METKRCSKCDGDKELSEFTKCKTSKDGLQYHCKECRRTGAKLWRENNSEKHKLIYKKHYSKNSKDINYKIKDILRSRFYSAVIKGYKVNSVINLLGCSINDLKNYLNSQFVEGMNWENYGVVWEIDHIKPCSSFDLTKLEEQQKCFDYKNLQPLFKTSEISKHYNSTQIGNRNKGAKVLA
jgi:hypothetical protein